MHLLKNEKTLSYIGCNKLSTVHRVGLTGTPLQNTFIELFTLVNFVHRNCLGTKKQFDQQYARPI